jgi:hypothetical protein
MRRLLVALAIALGPILPAQAQIRIDFGSHGVSIGIDVPVYPRLVRVPGYPVYYAPQANSNYFFYDGLYWVYQSDNWYASSWYNGPWEAVEPYDVPLYLLRVPVRYYRHPPAYFHGWRADAPPRWGEHWGNDWERRRSGWDQWDHRSVPAAAPLPAYQRKYSGDRYPRAPEQQVTIRSQNYRYQPHENVTQLLFQQPAAQAAPRAEPRQQAPVPQRSQAPQQRPQPSEPRQQTQPPQPRPAQPVQQAQPKQPVQQAQPKQPPAQAQRVPAGPQGKAPENRAAPQGNGPENKGESRGKGPENKAESKGKGNDNKAESKGKEKKEDRDTGRP